MAVAAEMKIASQPRVSARVVAERESKSRRELKRRRGTPKQPLNRRVKRADRAWVGRRKAAYCLTHRATVVNNTAVITMTEATVFAVNSFTLAAMATKTTLRHSKNAKASVTMLLVFAIWLRSTDAVPRTSQSGTLMLTHRNAKNLSLADVPETKITLTTNDPARMLASAERMTVSRRFSQRPTWAAES